jgi:ribosomal protein S18 acetylase RimI-like enzyme
MKKSLMVCKKTLELLVLKTNTPALRLYRKFGFRKKGEKRRSFTLGIDVKKQAATF